MALDPARWAESLGRLQSWRRWAVALVSGVVAAAALPPTGLVFLLVPAFCTLLWLIGTNNIRAAAVVGWWFGLGFFAASFYWVASAFLVEAERYGWLAPFAVFGLAAVMAVYTALATALTQLISQRIRLNDWARTLTLAGVWTFTEWLRGELLTGFPWNLIGNIWVVSDPMLQSAAWVGVFGLGLVTVAAASLPAVLSSGTSRRQWAMALSGIIVLALMAGGGVVRLNSAKIADIDGVRLRLVQPNIPQHLKWRPNKRLDHVRRQLTMSRQPPSAGKPPTHVIWAETAVPYNLFADRQLQKSIGTVAPKDGLVITGAPRGEREPGAGQKLWNSAHAISPAGNIVATYDKKHLVPFGEYVPMRSVLKFSKLTAGRLDFSSGTGPRVLDLSGLPPVAMLICYEVIFPDEILGKDQNTPRPGWLLNITNDAWFGVTTGPHQHLAAARLRAVEHGLPLVRVANTGISAIIDPYGRTNITMALGEAGVLDGNLPKALDPTIFSRFGTLITWFLIFVTIALPVTIGREN